MRVRVLAAGVSLPDIMRGRCPPETCRVPFTPGWDLVGVVDYLGGDISNRLLDDRRGVGERPDP